MLDRINRRRRILANLIFGVSFTLKAILIGLLVYIFYIPTMRVGTIPPQVALVKKGYGGRTSVGPGLKYNMYLGTCNLKAFNAWQSEIKALGFRQHFTRPVKQQRLETRYTARDRDESIQVYAPARLASENLVRIVVYVPIEGLEEVRGDLHRDFTDDWHGDFMEY